jgi:L-ascorbate metabolism protein UlaG (beta-lactamase superfamily)
VVSHDHPDHNFVQALQGKPRVVKGPGAHTVSGITFQGIPAYHDTSRGSERGENVIFCFTVDDVRLCHLGDLGHLLDVIAAQAIGTVDVLMMPVGGYYTIDAEAATTVMNILKPRLLIPMHFKTAKCGFPITTVDDFLVNKTGVRKLSTSEITVSRETLPVSTEIQVLTYAM